MKRISLRSHPLKYPMLDIVLTCPYPDRGKAVFDQLLPEQRRSIEAVPLDRSEIIEYKRQKRVFDCVRYTSSRYEK